MMTATTLGTVLTSPTEADDSDTRYARGIEVLKRIGGQNFDGPINNLARISPDMARFTVEYPYGDVLSRPGLDLRIRQICTVSSLIAQGSVQPQLRFHMDGLLNVGGTPSDLIELMVLSTAILGFPAAIDSIVIARQIFKDRGLDVAPSPAAADSADRQMRGVAAFNELMVGTPDAHLRALNAVSPELAQWTIEFVFGDVLSRDGLEPKAKHLAIASMLATQGNRAEALRQHVQGALKAGATPAEIIEALIQLSVYAGFPTALNALGVAKQAIDGFADAPTANAPAMSSGSEDDAVRRARGIATLKVTSGASGDAVIRSFDDIAPDIGAMIVDHSYGDIFQRPGLDPATRELTACAALAARGSKASQTPLRVHINAALNVGATRDQIVETLLNLLPYAGYPTVQDAMRIAGEEFAKRGI